MKIGIRERPTDPVLNAGHSRAFRSVVGELRIGAKKVENWSGKGREPLSHSHGLSQFSLLLPLVLFSFPTRSQTESLEQAMLSVLLRLCPWENQAVGDGDQITE